MNIPSPFGIPWPLIGIGAVLILIYGIAHFFEQSVRNDERRRAAEQVAEIQTEATAAIQQEAEAFRNRTRALDARLNQSLQALESVPDDASAIDFLTAYARADRRLHDGAPG